MAFPWKTVYIWVLLLANTAHFLPSHLLWKRFQREAQKKTIYWRHSPRIPDLDLKCFHLSIVSCWQCTLIIVFDLIDHVHFTWLNHMHAHARHISYVFRNWVYYFPAVPSFSAGFVCRNAMASPFDWPVIPLESLPNPLQTLYRDFMFNCRRRVNVWAKCRKEDGEGVSGRNTFNWFWFWLLWLLLARHCCCCCCCLCCFNDIKKEEEDA